MLTFVFMRRRLLRFYPSLFAVVALWLFASGCGRISYGNIPEKTVNFTVRPLSMDNTLMTVGSFKYFPYGYSGVCVYHIGDMEEEYVAFEQACPIDWENGCYVEYNRDKDRFVGIQCQCEFSSFTGYGYGKTASGFALRKYNITYLSNGDFQVSN